MSDDTMTIKRGNHERGATAVLVAVVIAMLFGFGALAVDVGHLYLSRGELQNAADACALAGARMLYIDEGATINTGCNQIGHDAGETNQSQKTAVEINWTSGNTGDVQRGHWNAYAHDGLSARTFTPNASTTVTTLWGVTDEQLDADTGFINAVRCVTRREAAPVTNFLAPVLGLFGGTGLATSIVRAEAVAIIGFAGRLEPDDVDGPIAICEDSILTNVNGSPTFDCTLGRMLNDSAHTSGSETAMWTNYENAPDGCGSLHSANEQTIQGTLTTEPTDPVTSGCTQLVGNGIVIDLGGFIATNNGVIDNLVSSPQNPDLMDAWVHACDDLDGHPETLEHLDGTDSDNLPEHSWDLTLPVIDCQSSGCNEIIGAVTISVVWIRDKNDPHFQDVPLQMDDWVCINPETGLAMARNRVNQFNNTINGQEPGQLCWYGDTTNPAHVGFAERFNLLNADGSTAPYDNNTMKAIFFKPECAPQPPAGHTGGRNFGTLSKYPALVR